MKTTLNEIRKYHPCESGWKKLLSYLGKTQADDEPLDLMTILESNGIEDAMWCLRCFHYRDYCLFNADIAESVIDIFHNKHPHDTRPQAAINAIRAWHSGLIEKDELIAAANAAYAADAAYAAADAAYAAAYAAADAADAAYAAVDAAYAAAYAAATDAATDAAYAAADAAYATVNAAYAARKKKWQEIEQLFIKHFKET